MTAPTTEKTTNPITSLRALREILARPGLRRQLESAQTRGETLAHLGIDDATACEIANVLADLETVQASSQEAPPVPSPRPAGEIETDRDFLYESFRQLRTAYRVSMTMSLVMFALGVGFLVLAAVRSFTDPRSLGVTSVIGGIGVVQVVALFYRNPLTHIARTVCNAQQAKMAVMSYLIGISLLHTQGQRGGTAEAQLTSLRQVTESALRQLETYAELGGATQDEAEPTAAPGQPATTPGGEQGP